MPVARIAPDTRGAGRRVGDRAVAIQSAHRRRPARGRAARARRKPVSPTTTYRSSRCPGALETPLALQRLAQRGDYDALVALGAVIRGDTYHFEIVANESAAGSRASSSNTASRSATASSPRHRRAGAARGWSKGLRGGAGGARARQPARRDRRSMSAAANDAASVGSIERRHRAPARARARAAGPLRAAAHRRRGRRHRASPWPKPRISRGGRGLFPGAVAGVTGEYDASLADARAEARSPPDGRSRRSSARCSSSARGNSSTAPTFPIAS